jgi:hypothetical protein
VQLPFWQSRLAPQRLPSQQSSPRSPQGTHVLWLQVKPLVQELFMQQGRLAPPQLGSGGRVHWLLLQSRPVQQSRLEEHFSLGAAQHLPPLQPRPLQQSLAAVQSEVVAPQHWPPWQRCPVLQLPLHAPALGLLEPEQPID